MSNLAPLFEMIGVLAFVAVGVFARVGAALFLVPGIGERAVPVRLRLGAALALTVVAWLTLKFHQRLRLFPMVQQALTILVLLILHQLLTLWISRFIGRPPAPWFFWAPSLLGMLIWPLVYAALRGIRQGFRIN